MDDLLLRGVGGLAQGLRERRFASAAIIEASLERIARIDPTLNSFVHVDAEGARIAAASDGRLSAGKPRSMLEGIPISVKDNILVAGLPATWGSRGLTAISCRRATSCRSRGCARRARSSSARPTCRSSRWRATRRNDLFGVTRNPWDTSLTPGGSSRRRGGERGRRAGAGGALHRRRRLDPAAREPHRPGRLQTLGRTDRAHRRVAGDPRRFRDRRHAHAHRRGHAADRHAARRRPARPPVAVRASRRRSRGRAGASCSSRISRIVRSIRRWRRPPPRSRASSPTPATRCRRATCSSTSNDVAAHLARDLARRRRLARGAGGRAVRAGSRRPGATDGRGRTRNSPAPTTSTRWSGSPRSVAAAPRFFPGSTSC